MESPKPIRRTLPKNLGLLEFIGAKREWDWKPSVEELVAPLVAVKARHIIFQRRVE
jgi:hypothetical protein